MGKPEPKFEEGTKVHDAKFNETFEFCYKTDWTIQDRLVRA